VSLMDPAMPFEKYKQMVSQENNVALTVQGYQSARRPCYNKDKGKGVLGCESSRA
jgi:hypothetical protein